MSLSKKIVLVTRDPSFSPNSIQRDYSLLKATEQLLLKRGLTVEWVEEKDLDGELVADVILSMARLSSSLECLQEIQERGIKVFPNPTKIIMGRRENLRKLFYSTKILCPKQILINTQNLYFDSISLKYPLWIKKAIGYTQKKSDINYVKNEREYLASLKNFYKIGINEVEVSEHIDGDLIKFYGVYQSDFFYYTYPTLGAGYSKIGCEKNNGTPNFFAFNVNELQKIANTLSEVSGISIYGGDAIITEEGKIYCIDFNDFPSFSTCLQQATKAIENLVMQSIKKDRK